MLKRLRLGRVLRPDRLLSKSGLRTKIVAWSFIPTAIILIAVALVTFFAYRQVAEVLVLERNRELTRLFAGQLSTELDEYVDLLTSIGRLGGLREGDPAEQRATLRLASNRLVVFDAGVLVLDNFGTVVAAQPERAEMLGRDLSERAFFQEMVRSPEPVFSDVVADGPGGEEVIAVAVPLLGDQGEFRGVVLGMFRLGETAVSAFYGSIVKLRAGGNGAAYLVDGRGRVIYHSDPHRILEDLSGQPIVEQAVGRQVAALRTRDLEGHEILASFAPVPGTGWGLVIEERWEAVTAPTRGYQYFLLFLLVLGVVLPGVVVAVGVRRITRPVQKLISATREVAGGKFDQVILARTGDEIEELARNFNLMASQLQDWYANLERKVEARTHELATLLGAVQQASSSLDLDEVLRHIARGLAAAVGVRHCAIYLVDEGSGLFLPSEGRSSPGDPDPNFGGVFASRVLDPSGDAFLREVVEGRRPLVCANAGDDPRTDKDVVKALGLKSILAVPFVVKDRVLAVAMLVTIDGTYNFAGEQIELAEGIANAAAIAIENARLYEAERLQLEESEQRRQVAEGLREILTVLNSPRPLNEVLALIVLQAVRLLEADAGAIYGTDLERGLITVEAVYGIPLEVLPEAPFPMSDLEANRATIERRPYTCSDLQATLAAEGVEVSELPPDSWLGVVCRRFKAFMSVPLVVQEDLYGDITLYYRGVRDFSEEQIRLALAFADQVALAIENARLRASVGETAAAAERSRLARDLHDAVTQTLFSASLIAEVLPRLYSRSPEEGQRRLEELRQLTRGALAEMRTLLLELRPAALMEVGLGELLRQLSEAMTSRARLHVDLSLEGACPLPPDVQVAMYRIAQEALNNVAKHAGASRASVILRCEQGGPIELVIRDDGRGFETKGMSPDQLGLAIMRERAESIGAGLEIESQIGGGTTVKAVWHPALEEERLR